MGTGTQQEFPVNTTIKGLLIYLAFMLCMIPVATTFAHRLAEATAQQCKAQAWPEHQHQAHMDFCAKEGYPTN
jgi:hypothetical protein